MQTKQISPTRLISFLSFLTLIFGLFFSASSLAQNTEASQDNTAIQKENIPVEQQKEATLPVDKVSQAISYYHQGKYNEAATVFLAPESQKSAEVNCYLGNMYALGLGFTKDEKKAHDYYVEAARQGNTMAMFSLGVIYAQGLGVPKNYPVAAEWYAEATKQNYVPAMLNLANLYIVGLGVEQNYETARNWYEKAAEQGDGNAMCNLGNLYRYGYGVSMHFAGAKEWYEKGAAKNNECCLLNLAWFYFRGWGTKQDLKQALELDKTAALRGNPVAAFNLARMYHYGMGTDTNPKQAWYWYNQSAENNYAPAIEQIAIIYRQGILGQEANAEKAAEWQKRAKETAKTVATPHDPFSAGAYGLDSNVLLLPVQ